MARDEAPHQGPHTKEKNLELERLVFFSDAVVAIAITLLVIDLKVDVPLGEHLTFRHLWEIWPKYVGFLVSFMQIGAYWQVHHQFYYYIRRIDHRLMGFNMLWLLFIVLVPFTTSLVSAHLYDRAAILAYSLNILAVTIFQNFIWDYASFGEDYLADDIDKATDYSFRYACNLSIFLSLLACIVSLFWPIVAFILLFFRPSLLWATRFYVRYEQMQAMKERHPKLVAKIRRFSSKPRNRRPRRRT